MCSPRSTPRGAPCGTSRRSWHCCLAEEEEGEQEQEARMWGKLLRSCLARSCPCDPRSSQRCARWGRGRGVSVVSEVPSGASAGFLATQ